ncbi:cytochrome c biogenesis protein CcdA [Undibacterium sp. Jales W-56]|uniref:cytochrome c biogenesis CcdA family protein n=1 Tax=Undibacterium sp. Jales W-56 TaxID=2897325 RepID=UPI0021CFAB26|nr:cytochrome c biogenesis protein CcdA [Undibacterium sp. Jales W-56]MCU6435254.1 cytochrome c biogenesis protein CcdA [Undibacterium sp. Jales W-56]
MDAQSLQAGVSQASAAALGGSFVTGFVFSFNPVAFAAIPVSLAYVTKAQEQRRAVLYGGMFILGLLVVHAFLGLIAGLGGSWVQSLLGRFWGLLPGPMLIILGAMWPGWIKIKLPTWRVAIKPISGPFGAFLLGIPFSVAICPFCTPALLILLGVAASIGSPWYGIALLLAFALGRAVPILIGAAAIGWLEEFRILGRYQKVFEVTGAVVLILAGLYMLNAYFFVIPSLAG